MKKEKINRVDFSEIFYFAEEKFNVNWNRANNMFFHHSLDYKSFNEYSLGEPLEYIGCEDDVNFEELNEPEKGYYIINEYMKHHNIDSIFITNG